MDTPQIETTLTSLCHKDLRGSLTPKVWDKPTISNYEHKICPQCPLALLYICLGFCADEGVEGDAFVDTMGRPLTIFEAVREHKPMCNITKEVPYQEHLENPD